MCNRGPGGILHSCRALRRDGQRGRLIDGKADSADESKGSEAMEGGREAMKCWMLENEL